MPNVVIRGFGKGGGFAKIPSMGYGGFGVIGFIVIAALRVRAAISATLKVR
jgi:hypothetical protein